MYKAMSSADRDTFTSYFLSAFSYLSRISSIRLNISTVIFVLLLILVGKLSDFSIKCVVICEVSVDAFYQNGITSFCSCFAGQFKIKGYWISLYWCRKYIPVSSLGRVLLFTNRLESKLSNEQVNKS